MKTKDQILLEQAYSDIYNVPEKPLERPGPETFHIFTENPNIYNYRDYQGIVNADEVTDIINNAEASKARITKHDNGVVVIYYREDQDGDHLKIIPTSQVPEDVDIEEFTKFLNAAARPPYEDIADWQDYNY